MNNILGIYDSYFFSIFCFVKKINKETDEMALMIAINCLSVWWSILLMYSHATIILKKIDLAAWSAIFGQALFDGMDFLIIVFLFTISHWFYFKKISFYKNILREKRKIRPSKRWKSYVLSLSVFFGVFIYAILFILFHWDN